MAKATDSKGKTLAAAAKLFRQQGYHGTALHDILAAGLAPRCISTPGGKGKARPPLTLVGGALRQGIARQSDPDSEVGGCGISAP